MQFLHPIDVVLNIIEVLEYRLKREQIDSYSGNYIATARAVVARLEVTMVGKLSEPEVSFVEGHE